MRVIKLTPWEVECLQHRADVPDAVAEAMSEDMPPASAEAICNELGKRLAAIKGGGALTIDDDDQAAILEELVDGSTFLSCAIDELPFTDTNKSCRTGQWLAQAERTLTRKFDRLREKVSL